MKFKKIFITSCIAIGILSLASCAPKTNQNPSQTQQVNYPQKTIKIINLLPANIPPDLTTRKIASLMSDKYGWKFEFENDPTLRGGSAMNKVWSAPHDGHTILAHTEVIIAPTVYGTANHPTKDWRFFISEQDDTVLCVRSDLKINNFQDFIKYAKANPGKLRIGVSSPGYAFHLKTIAMEKVAGVKLDIRTYPGSKGQIEDIKNGKLDAIINPIQVTKPLVTNGTVIPIISTDIQSYDFGGSIGNIESITKIYPEYKKYLPLDSFISMAMPADVPQGVADAFAKAFTEVMSSPEMTESARRTNATIIDLTGTEASQYMSKLESNFAWLSKDEGLAKVDPATLGIPKPQ